MNLLACPICLNALKKQDRSLACAMNHTFDIAREGYVNLLLPQHRHSRQPGDNADMAASRTRFLDAGFYHPLAMELQRILSQFDGPLVDLGCGEGYFTALMSAVASPVYGIDISKPAIKAACKRAREVTFVVSSTAHLPFADESLGIAMVVMAPFGKDVSRVVRRGGVLIRVTPGPAHLQELKQMLYAAPRQHERAAEELATFALVESVRQETRIAELSRENLADLIGMTPLRYRTSKVQQAEIERRDTTPVTIDFQIDIFARQ